MSRSLLAVLALTVGCSGARSEKVTVDLSIDDYHGFSSSAAWTYRDDGVLDAPPDDEQLLRARYTGNGIMDLRRGSRWAGISAAVTTVISDQSKSGSHRMPRSFP